MGAGVTDCPNCSWPIEVSGKPQTAECPFCGITFNICDSAFLQLKNYLEYINPSAVKSSFFAPEYAVPMPFKNFAGWIVRRIEADEPSEVIKLMALFLDDRLVAMQVKTLWNYDFSPYFEAAKETYTEIRALWLTACFNTMPNDSTIPLLLSKTMWTASIHLNIGYIDSALKRLNYLRLKEPPELRDDPVKKDDLVILPPADNPLFNWALQAPIAIRQRLSCALAYCGHGGTSKITYDHPIQLDHATYYDDRLAGVDYGYATKMLMESNIFCEPDIKDLGKLLSKDKYFTLLTELGIPVKKSYTRMQMFNLLMDFPNGAEGLRKKIGDNHYVRLHPTLEKYAKELLDYQRRIYNVWNAISLLGDFKRKTKRIGADE